MAATAPGKTQSTVKRTLFSRISFSLFFFLIFLAAGLLAVLTFGRCSGDEFSAADFSRRAFHYFRLPIIKVQVSTVFRQNTPNDLVRHLQRKKYFPAAKPRWQVMRHSTGFGPPYEADELILCDYLDQRDSSYRLRWLRWSRDNPKLARVFWPVVWRVANENLYLLVPDLFQRARFATNPTDLGAELRRLIIRDGSSLAADEQALGHHQRAAQVAAFVISVANLGNDTARQDPDPQPLKSDWIQTAIRIESEAIASGAKQVQSDPLPTVEPESMQPSTDDASREEKPKKDDPISEEPIQDKSAKTSGTTT